MYLLETKRNNNENKNDLITNDENNDELKNEESIKNSYDQAGNNHSDFDHKLDEENDYIENEVNFYDFDELLLQYRPLEIELLMKSLMDLKQSLIITSEDRGIGGIIDFSYSENLKTEKEPLFAKVI